MKSALVIVGLLASCISGHMQMSNPYPIRSPLNQGASGQKDYSYTNPLKTDGSDYPCKGYTNDPFHSVATYSPGQEYEMSLSGSATHSGGSCQVSLSYDQGKNFKVIHSILGGCPLTDKYNFQIPSDAPGGQALLAWTWFNKIGNREMYMNCAQVTIRGGSEERKHPRDMSPAFTRRDGGSFDRLPPIFQANNNGPGHCKTIEGEEVNFPVPGPSVEGSLSGTGYKCADHAPFLGNGDDDYNSPKQSTSSWTSSSEDEPEYTWSQAPKMNAKSRARPSTPEFRQITPAEISHRPVLTVTDSAYDIAETLTETCADGAIICSNDGQSWSLCDNGQPVHMGPVAPGTQCTHGNMQLA